MAEYPATFECYTSFSGARPGGGGPGNGAEASGLALPKFVTGDDSAHEPVFLPRPAVPRLPPPRRNSPAFGGIQSAIP